MKEKTFEEMIEEYLDIASEICNTKVHTLNKTEIKELMQQVREATIAECKEVLKDFNDGFGFEMLERNSLPTDRIKTDL